MAEQKQQPGELITAIAALLGISESQIQEQITWGTVTHIKIPAGQWGLLAGALVMLQVGLLLPIVGGTAIYLKILWLAVLAFFVWIPVLLPSVLLTQRLWRDLQRPFWKRSPAEEEVIGILDKVLVQETTDEDTGERIIILRARTGVDNTGGELPDQERQAEIDRSLFASFVARLPHKGTAIRYWPELRREQYQEFRDRLIDAEYATWNSYQADGTPNERRGWQLVAPVREVLRSLR